MTYISQTLTRYQVGNGGKREYFYRGIGFHIYGRLLLFGQPVATRRRY